MSKAINFMLLIKAIWPLGTVLKLAYCGGFWTPRLPHSR